MREPKPRGTGQIWGSAAPRGGLVSPGEMDLVLRILDQYCFSAGFLMSVQQGL